MTMRPIIIAAVFILLAGMLHAKKVKFSVDMRGQVVDTAGVHVTGDFQDEAGFVGGDWITNTALMTQEVSDTNIYSIVVDIPAFRHYEFKYVNGDQGYQQEFVPLESRVNYNFIDNRWIYIDSLSNDTQALAAVRFGMNAPVSMNLVRLYVDMQNETAVSGNGIHVGGSFQSWLPNTTQMYSFDGNVYEYIFYTDSGNVSTQREYRFLNGNTNSDYEALAGWCQNANGNRSVIAPRDTMMPVVCFTFCDACSTAGVQEQSSATGVSILPNPTNDQFHVHFNSSSSRSVIMYDAAGRNVQEFYGVTGTDLQIDVRDLAKGLYNIVVLDADSGTAMAYRVVVN